MKCQLITLFVFILSYSRGSCDFRISSPWSWSCIDADKVCQKVQSDGMQKQTSLATCKLTCGEHGALWPRPSDVTLSKDVIYFNLDDVTHKLTCSSSVYSLLEESVQIWKTNVRYNIPSNNEVNNNVLLSSKHQINIDITVQNEETDLLLHSDESYSLQINTDSEKSDIIIIAATFFGGRHALETLSQLINYDEFVDSLQMISSATVTDAPQYTHRGIALDTSRNYIPVKDIERTFDAMAANKLNTFHWHMTDTHSFPLMLNSIPFMAYYGAYSSHQVYYPKDILHLIEYARVRGIKIIPEIDVPAHVGNGWQWGPLFGYGELAVCVNQDPWTEYCVQPPCGQLNIANDKIYDVLETIYTELIGLFGSMEVFHYGGDEVHLHCWNTSKEITDWMSNRNIDLTEENYYNEWNAFQTEAQQRFDKANGKDALAILWTSHLTESGNVNKYLDPLKNMIQIWTTDADPIIQELLQSDFKLIFSNYDAWYLDCGMGAWVGDGNNWCSPYKGWQLVYNNSLSTMAAGYEHLVLGGEAALWTEQADHTSLDAKLWPRGAALAERLWTNPSESWEAAETRFIHHRQRLVERGIHADRLQPQWCHQNEGKCVL